MPKGSRGEKRPVPWQPPQFESIRNEMAGGTCVGLYMDVFMIGG